MCTCLYVSVLVAVVEHVVTVVGTTERKVDDDWFTLLDLTPKKPGIISMIDSS